MRKKIVSRRSPIVSETARIVPCTHPHLRGVGFADSKGRRVQYCEDCERVIPKEELEKSKC